MFKVYNAAGEEKVNESGFAPQAVVCRAHASADVGTGTGYQTINTALNVKDFDPYNFFSLVTNRFQPNIPGYYRVLFNFAASGVVGNDTECFVRKNGVNQGMALDTSTANWFERVATALVYLNGTTDYVDMQIYTNTAVTLRGNASSQHYTYFEAELDAASVGVAPEPWTPFPFASNWTNYGGSGNESCFFMKDPHGFVHLKGLAKNVGVYTFGQTTAMLGTLPAGYRPGIYGRNIPCSGHDAGAGDCIYRVLVNEVGAVWINTTGAPSSGFSGAVGAYVWLDPISFRAEN